MMAIPMVRRSAPATHRQALRTLAIAVAGIGVAGVFGLAVAGFGGILSLAAVGGLSVVLVLLRWPEAATLLFAFGLYINIPAVAKDYYGVPDVVAAGLVGLLLIPVVGHVIRREPLVVTPALPLLIVYLGVLALSTAVALIDGLPTGLGAIELFVTEGLIVFVLITNVVRTRESLRHVTWALLAAGALMGALSVHQAVTESYDSHYGGFAQVYGRAVEDPDAEAQPRAAGPVGEKNRYAQVMLVLLPLALVTIWSERSRWLKLAAGGAALLTLSAILLTFSRGAGIGLAVLLIALLVLRHVRPMQLGLMVLAGVLAVALLAPTYGERLGSIAAVQGLFSEEAEDPDGSILGRTTSNLAALNVFLDHPVVGVGPGMYAPYYSYEYANELALRRFTENRRAHNLYVETAAELGIIGLAVLLAIVGTTLLHLWRARRRWLARGSELGYVATGFGLAVVAYMTTAAFLHLSYQRYFWLLLGLANAAVWILARQTGDGEEVSTGAGQGATSGHDAPAAAPGR